MRENLRWAVGVAAGAAITVIALPFCVVAMGWERLVRLFRG